MGNKIHVTGSKMSVAEGVAEARHMSEFLLQREFRGPGDTIEAAAYRAQARWGVPATIIQRLRHRNVTDMLLSNWWLLKVAYSNACEQQAKQLAHEVELAKVAGLNAATTPSLAAAEAALCKTESETERLIRRGRG